MKCHACEDRYKPHTYKGDVAGESLLDHCLPCVKDLLESARKYNMGGMWTNMSNKPILPDGTRKERQEVIQRHKQRTSAYSKLARQCERMIELVNYELNHS